MTETKRQRQNNISWNFWLLWATFEKLLENYAWFKPNLKLLELDVELCGRYNKIYML
jgi:hypothetical protein